VRESSFSLFPFLFSLGATRSAVALGGVWRDTFRRKRGLSPVIVMRVAVTKIRDLKIVLKDLERHVKAPDFLRKGREFRNFALRPREVLTNWLICAVGNFEEGDARLTFCTDPFGGDGLILNQKDGKYISTEHVFIPTQKPAHDGVEQFIYAAAEHKAKRGAHYASGKHLVILSEAIGLWHPNRAARGILRRHGFDSVWVVHLEVGNDSGYTYCVTLLDVSKGNAPAWKVLINGDFTSWTVQRIQ